MEVGIPRYSSMVQTLGSNREAGVAGEKSVRGTDLRRVIVAVARLNI